MKFSQVILIDDDSITNFLNTEIISFFNATLSVVSFSEPEKSIAHILYHQDYHPEQKVLVLLDINMPLISGWDVVQAIEKEKPELFSYLQIHLLTSSIDENDKKRAKENPNISSILHKPLEEEMLQVIFND